MDKPWARVSDSDAPTAEVLIHRAPRYHGRDFSWAEAVALVRDRAEFVGSPDEHRTFCDQFGHIPYIPTPTLLDLAQAMAGLRSADGLFVGNQSTPRAVAESLKVNVLVEEDHWSQNTHYTRAGRCVVRAARVGAG